MGLSIRQADNADIPEVVRVIKAVYDEYGFAWEEDGYHADLYDIESAYTAVGDSFYVAEWEGRVVGTSALELFDPIPGGEDELVQVGKYVRVAGCDCSIERLYVHPEGRRKGVGRTLMQKVIDEAVAAGRTRMEIWSDKKFVDAHRLYEQFGAKVVGERICDDPDVSPEWGLVMGLGR